MSDNPDGEIEHVVNVKRVLEHRGQTSDPERLLGKKVSTNLHGWTREVGVGLDVVGQVRSTFNCSCGERFLKAKTAAKHLKQVSDDAE